MSPVRFLVANLTNQAVTTSNCFFLCRKMLFLWLWTKSANGLVMIQSLHKKHKKSITNFSALIPYNHIAIYLLHIRFFISTILRFILQVSKFHLHQDAHSQIFKITCMRHTPHGHVIISSFLNEIFNLWDT